MHFSHWPSEICRKATDIFEFLHFTLSLIYVTTLQRADFSNGKIGALRLSDCYFHSLIWKEFQERLHDVFLISAGFISYFWAMYFSALYDTFSLLHNSFPPSPRCLSYFLEHPSVFSRTLQKKRWTFSKLSPTFSEKTPTFFEKSPTFFEKSPTFFLSHSELLFLSHDKQLTLSHLPFPNL